MLKRNISKSKPRRLIKATPVIRTKNVLGEGPLWHPMHQILYWVDIESKLIHGWEPHTQLHREWPVSKRVGTVVPMTNGNLLLGLHGEIAALDLASGKEVKLCDIESDLPENRCNDGKCDPAGRFWVGTMNLDTKKGSGALYCVDHEFNVNKVLSGLTIANGMGWSPDAKHMYFIDSAEHHVRRYTFNATEPVLEDEKTVLKFDDLPDGMCVDAEGMLWIGFWGGHRVGRYDPSTGAHLADVRIPAPHVTSCCFGGKDLKTLFITTAGQGLSDEQLDEFPLSGSLFSCKPGVKGLPADFFGRNS